MRTNTNVTMQDNAQFLGKIIESMPKDVYDDIYINKKKYHLSFDGKYWKRIKSCEFCGYAPTPDSPLISLSSPQSGSYVLGQSIGPIDLNSTTTKMTNDIKLVTFKRGTSVINTINPATALGGLETYSDIGPFTNNQSRTSYVEDMSGLNNVSNIVSISFGNYFYRGADPLTTITETEIEALENNTVKNTFSGVYAFGTELGSYKYFARPTRLGQPSDPTLDFIDNDTGFPIPFQLQGIVNITNTYGYAEDYYVYRSVNVLGGALNIKVQP